MDRLTAIFMTVGQRKLPILFGIIAVLLLLVGCMHTPSPYPPSGLEAIPASSESISLTWQDNDLTEDGFYVYRRSTGGYNRIAALGADVTSYDDLDLDGVITYWYKVTAYNTGGESNPSKEKSATTEEEAQAFFDLSTPENAVRSFVEATLMGDREKAEQCLSDTIPDSTKAIWVAFVIKEFEEEMEEDPTLKEAFQSPELAKMFSALLLYEKEKIHSDAFYVWMVFSDETGGKEDSFEVVREGGKWKIALIPDMEDFGDVLEEEESRGFFDLSTPENTVRSYVEAILLGDNEKARECLSETIPDSMKTLIFAFTRVLFEEVSEEDPVLKEIFQSPELVEMFSAFVLYEKEKIHDDAFYVWAVFPDGTGAKEDAYEVVKEKGRWKIALPADTEYFGDLLEEEETGYEEGESDFYGERLTVSRPPEDAFWLYFDEGEMFIVRYEEEGEEMVDSSIYSRAVFDPDGRNVLLVSITNDGRFPIELDYDTDRYYVGSYGGRVYQCKIDLDVGYDVVINPGDLTIIGLVFPPNVSDIDIKNIVIELAEGDIVIGLQKVPK